MNYLINKGEHRSVWRPNLHFGLRELSYRVTFDRTCKYESTPAMGINKLFGISYGVHHRDSIRVGWDYSNSQLNLYSYTYNKGERDITRIGQVDLETEYIIKIKTDFKENRFMIQILNRYGAELSAYIDVFNFPKFKIGYRLFPYFGGKIPAPQDIYLELN